MRERFEWALAAALLALLRAVPLKTSYRIAYAAARVLDLTLPKLRKVAASNLAMACPELTFAARTQITEGVFRTVGRLLVAIARFPGLNQSNISGWISYQG